MKKIQDKKSMKTTRNALALYTKIIQTCYEREQMKDEPDADELIRLKTMRDDAIKATLMLIPNWLEIEHSAPVSGNNLDELIDLIDSLKDKGAKK